MKSFAAVTLFMFTIVSFLLSLFLMVLTIDMAEEPESRLGFLLLCATPLAIGIIGFCAIFQWEKRGKFIKHFKATLPPATNRAEDYILRILKESPNPLWQLIVLVALIPTLILCGILLFPLFFGLLGEPEYPWNMVQWAIPSCGVVICLALIAKWRAAREVTKVVAKGFLYSSWIVAAVLFTNFLRLGMWQVAIAVVAAPLILFLLSVKPWKKD